MTQLSGKKKTRTKQSYCIVLFDEVIQYVKQTHSINSKIPPDTTRLRSPAVLPFVLETTVEV